MPEFCSLVIACGGPGSPSSCCFSAHFPQALDALVITAGLVTLVLEEDGTVVDTEEFFQTLGDNTHFMLLEDGQKWTPVSGCHDLDGAGRGTRGPRVADLVLDRAALYPPCHMAQRFPGDP